RRVVPGRALGAGERPVQSEQGVRRRRSRVEAAYVAPAGRATPIGSRGMRIAVCVKHVPEGSSRIDAGSKRLARSGEGTLNHFDANAVEEALRLKGDGEGEVVVVSMGPEKAADSLRKALAMGADRAVLVSDAAAEGSDLVATSKVLAGALARESADLV